MICGLVDKNVDMYGLGHIILTDFGLSAKLPNSEAKLHSFSGTAIYLGWY